MREARLNKYLKGILKYGSVLSVWGLQFGK